jgi:hypothetical protein
MKLRILLPLIAAALAAALSPVAVAGAAGGAKPAAKVKLDARLTRCPVPGLAAKPVAFAASMPALAGSGSGARMAMRFELQQRGGGRPWLPVIGVPSFDQWEQSQPGRPGFVVTKKVKGLPPGGAYRAVVRFRWLNDQGAVVHTARRATGLCLQPDTRPDLAPTAPAIVPATRSDLVVYRISVANKGKGKAASSDVSVEVNGTVQPAQRIDPLDPKATTDVTFQAPRCATGSIVRFRVDASDELAEIDERNNLLERRCVAYTATGQPAATASFRRLRATL